MFETAAYTVNYQVYHGSIYQLLLVVFSSIGGIYMIMFTLNTVATCFVCEDRYASLPISSPEKKGESELSNQRQMEGDESVALKIMASDAM